jgi:hypothetical protein
MILQEYGDFNMSWYILFSSLHGLFIRQLSPWAVAKLLADGWMLWGEYATYGLAIDKVCEISTR